MKNIAIILSVLLSGCAAQANLLVGTWRYDSERTQNELRQNLKSPTALLKCYEQKLCGDGALTYSETDWWQSSSSALTVPDPKTPYSLKAVSADRVEVQTTIQGESTIYVVTFLGANEHFVEASLNGFNWKEYFRRAR